MGYSMARLYLLVAVLAVLSVVVATASYNVAITVSDNGVPVSGAVVEAYDINNTLVASGVTNADGTVSLNLTDGQYTLKILYGNNTYTYNITVDANHTVFEFDIGDNTATTATTATGNATRIACRVKEWWSSLDLGQKAVIVVAGLVMLYVLVKRVV